MTEDSMHRTLREALARNSGPSAEDVEARVEASSLGTPEAKALRATVSDEHAARIVARAAELEDVEALRALLTALRYSSHIFTTHEMAERIATSDWLATHTAAAKRECAQAVVEAVEAEGRKYHGVTPFAVKQAMIAAARAALEGGA